MRVLTNEQIIRDALLVLPCICDVVDPAKGRTCLHHEALKAVTLLAEGVQEPLESWK